jgi:hypothetical protein
VTFDPTGTGRSGRSATAVSITLHRAAYSVHRPQQPVLNGTWRINNDMTAFANYNWSKNTLLPSSRFFCRHSPSGSIRQQGSG